MNRIILLPLVACFVAGCRITLSVDGEGTVISQNGSTAFDCDETNGPDCFEQYTAPQTETLLAVPKTGYTLGGWQGCNFKTLYTCETVISQGAIDGNLPWNITAEFREIDPQVQAVSYTYNGLGQRLTKTVGTTTTVFLYDLSGNLIAELDSTGKPLREHIHIDNQPIAQVSTNPVDRSTTIQYVHPDHLGTPTLLTDSGQAVIADIEATPFGKAFVDYAAVTYNRRFPGQYKDEETGYHYNYFRDYDPSLGRYIQSDPIGLRGGLNTYAYVGGNPVVYTDPYGLVYSSLAEHGVFYSNSVANVVPDGAQINLGNLVTNQNGTMFPGFTVQDWKCSLPGIGCAMDNDPAMLQRCINHDQCYDNNSCNSSSWLGNALGANKSCNQCNSNF